jgi:GH15 family glucan-1,4-alpha-glucosidase
VYGEVVDALYLAAKTEMEVHEAFGEMLRGIVNFVRDHWDHCPDAGMWEFRGNGRQFVESRVMAWVVFDRAIKLVECGKLHGPVDEWREVRDRIHKEVLERGFDAKRKTFVQSYGAKEVDASLLLIAQVGFLPPDDPRIQGTVEAVERTLFEDPFVRRYALRGVHGDGFADKEGAFIACSFWLCDMYVLLGRFDEAEALFERILRIRNDVGLLSEEYDPKLGRMLGNFPQAFSHLALVNTAYNLIRHHGPAKQRAQGKHSA